LSTDCNNTRGFHDDENSSRVAVFCVLTPCGNVVGYQCFGGPSGWNEDEGRKVFRNVGILPHRYRGSQPRRPRLEHSSWWKPSIPNQISVACL